MLMRGMLISFSDPNIGLVPTLVPFQYNPAEVTRTIKVNKTGTSGGPGLRVQDNPTESYTLKIELDGVDAVDKPITGVMGVQPLLAAIEAMLEPTGSLGVIGAVGSALAGAVSALTGGGPAGGAHPGAVAPARRPRVERHPHRPGPHRQLHRPRDGFQRRAAAGPGDGRPLADRAARHRSDQRPEDGQLRRERLPGRPQRAGHRRCRPRRGADAVTASRYAGQATITVPQDDGTTRPLGVPRVALALTAAITYQVRDGDRLDLLAAAALSDSTGWWRIADANPNADALADTQPGTVIGIPGE